eukprot:9621621-Ditylum_brightwellii.AAC.1
MGRDALTQANSANWWEWSDGLALLFWRWPAEFCHEARDGTPMFYVKQDLPNYKGMSSLPSCSKAKEKVFEKLDKLLDMRYVSSGRVRSITTYFAVPKGKDGICMVYDASKSGLNNALWAPNFGLPTVDSIIRMADSDSWFGDIDVGEMLHNYPLD